MRTKKGHSTPDNTIADALVGKTISAVVMHVHAAVFTFTDGSSYTVNSQDDEGIVGLFHELKTPKQEG